MSRQLERVEKILELVEHPGELGTVLRLGLGGERFYIGCGGESGKQGPRLFEEGIGTFAQGAQLASDEAIKLLEATQARHRGGFRRGDGRAFAGLDVAPTFSEFGWHERRFPLPLVDDQLDSHHNTNGSAKTMAPATA